MVDKKLTELPNAGTLNPGDYMYLVQGSTSTKVPLSLVIAEGDDGIDGINGLSAYEIAVNEGFVGDISAWLASLQGADGTGSGGQTGHTIVGLTHSSPGALDIDGATWPVPGDWIVVTASANITSLPEPLLIPNDIGATIILEIRATASITVDLTGPTLLFGNAPTSMVADDILILELFWRP